MLEKWQWTGSPAFRHCAQLPLPHFLTEAVVKEIIASGIVPEGAYSSFAASANGILDHVINQDVVTFYRICLNR